MRTYRVSNVAAFGEYEADPDGDFDRLIEMITGEFKPSQAMRGGTAFHKVLELAQAGQEIDRIRQGDFVFVIKADIVLPVTPIRELRARKVYMVDGEPIGISGQVDAIEGLTVQDHKTTGHFDAERYLSGAQWKLYLDLFEANRFVWNVFEVKEVSEDPNPTSGDETGDPFALGPFVYEVTGQHTLEQYRYPTMTRDMQGLVERFARFVREHVEEVPA